MRRAIFSILLVATGTVWAHAGPLEDAILARDLGAWGLARLDSLDIAGRDPIALAEQLRVEVHVPLVQLSIPGGPNPDYDRSELRPFQDCFEAGLEVDRFSNEVEYALKIGAPIPEMVNRSAYDAASAACDAAIKAASKPD